MWSEYIHLLHDPAHILFELTLMAVIDGLILGAAKRWVRKHDATKHGVLK